MNYSGAQAPEIFALYLKWGKFLMKKTLVNLFLLTFASTVLAAEGEMIFSKSDQYGKFNITMPSGWTLKVTQRSKLSEWVDLEPGQKDEVGNDSYGFFDEKGREQGSFSPTMEPMLTCKVEDLSIDAKIDKKSFEKIPSGCGVLRLNDKGAQAPLYAYRYGQSLENEAYYSCQEAKNYEVKNLKKLQEACRSIHLAAKPSKK